MVECSSWVLSLAFSKPGVVAQAFNTGTPEVEDQVFKVTFGYTCIMSLRPARIAHTHRKERVVPVDS